MVIIPTKNGAKIWSCFDYKLVTAVTASMEYAMPLVDVLLTELDSYQ